jgi:hypothetical protein
MGQLLSKKQKKIFQHVANEVKKSGCYFLTENN